jgi:hypothetical protein
MPFLTPTVLAYIITMQLLLPTVLGCISTIVSWADVVLSELYK